MGESGDYIGSVRFLMFTLEVMGMNRSDVRWRKPRPVLLPQ